jgi:hypothetical protein
MKLKILSILAIFILATSTLGSLAAVPDITIIDNIRSNISYEFDLNKETYISSIDLENVKSVLEDKKLDFSEYFAVSTLYGASFITPIKELPALKYDKVIDEDFDPTTKTLIRTIDRITLIVWS